MRHRSPILPVESRRRPFSSFARAVSSFAGRPATFLLACLLILGWLVMGPIFHFSNTWQLVINTCTTIATFLMVFLIQNTQNRDGLAVQVKLDELIRSDSDAHNALLDLEDLTEEELEMIKDRYERLAQEARAALQRGGKDTGIPRV